MELPAEPRLAPGRGAAPQGRPEAGRRPHGDHRGSPALHQRDCEASGFQWLVGDDAENSVIARLRRGDGGAEVVVVCTTLVPRHGYRIGVPAGGFYREALNTDAAIYGGGNIGNGGGVHAEPVEAHGQAQSISLTLPPLAALFLVRGRSAAGNGVAAERADAAVSLPPSKLASASSHTKTHSVNRINLLK